MSITALAERRETSVGEFSPEQLALIKRTVAKGVSDDELTLFLYTARTRGLDPLLRQIHAVSRWSKREKRNVMTIQVAIDGYRLLADRTGFYAGNDDAVFVEGDTYPETATVTVYKLVQNVRCPFTATARWLEYYPGDEESGGFMWRKMPHTMLAKCAEALALRKAFPAHLSGLYIPEEMAQASSDIIETSGRTVNTSTGEVVQEGKAPSRSGGSSSRKVRAGTDMVTDFDDPLYQRYSELYEEAQGLEVEAEIIQLPISVADLTVKGRELTARLAVAREQHHVAVEQDGSAF
jgi:phage recombination protein Bet